MFDPLVLSAPWGHCPLELYDPEYRYNVTYRPPSEGSVAAASGGRASGGALAVTAGVLALLTAAASAVPR